MFLHCCNVLRYGDFSRIFLLFSYTINIMESANKTNATTDLYTISSFYFVGVE